MVNYADAPTTVWTRRCLHRLGEMRIRRDVRRLTCPCAPYAPATEPRLAARDEVKRRMKGASERPRRRSWALDGVCRILPAMNAFTGSLQRKGHRYYLVVTLHHHQKWVSLNTDRLSLARQRAALISPRAPDDEERWLAHLIRLGEEARSSLNRKKSRKSVPWGRLWPSFRAQSPLPISETSAISYRRWIEILSDLAPSRRPPSSLTKADAQKIAEVLRSRYLSAPRMLRFFRRVWRVMGWDASTWKLAVRLGLAVAARETDHEFYRRLETEEVARVVNHFGSQGRSLAQAYADMIIIGYYTGLRLSDVAELERSEVSSGGQFLVLLPNKTRRSRRRPLRIPLVGPAAACVQRRVSEAKGGDRLFPDRAQRNPTKAIGRAFRSCGVLKRGNGRASFHSLRATFISLMDEAGVPPHVTDAITGHAGGGMHARYTQPSDAAHREAVARAIPLL